MDPINIPPMLAYIPYMDPMGWESPKIDGKIEGKSFGCEKLLEHFLV